jgi:hypothetical protein
MTADRGERMRRYELRQGRRAIGLREGTTAQEALMDYVRSLGCRDDEIARLGADALSWRGAVYRAVPVPPQYGDSADSGSPA